MLNEHISESLIIKLLKHITLNGHSKIFRLNIKSRSLKDTTQRNDMVR